ncbi:NUMOD4 domain-containing protein [uncultured Bacteroides sp.]|uniref:NUMOD4 domain-containing protein n=1 Tax=uncultured Bacteroides sp. TaxID=162156 RepID=UPI0026052A16|nr:NUMOD4 domain-containing protein [uncultured Bacteroides sp.]
MEETWKPVKGYEDRYSVSNTGKVKSLKTSKLMCQRKGYDGYMRVGLSINGKQKYKFVHRLVTEAFIRNPHCYKEVNHKDEDKANNCISNLEWCTHKYNSNYGSRLDRMANTNKEPVLQFDKSGKFIARYSSQKEAMEKTGINCKHISCCCKGNRKTCGGYVWKYAKSAILNDFTP